MGVESIAFHEGVGHRAGKLDIKFCRMRNSLWIRLSENGRGQAISRHVMPFAEFGPPRIAIRLHASVEQR
jgi:hypothetical protein